MESPIFFGGDGEYSDIEREARELVATFPSINFIDLSEIQIGKKIGIGGMGEVYYAVWNHTPIALKRIFRGEKALTDWLKEVKILRWVFIKI